MTDATATPATPKPVKVTKPKPKAKAKKKGPAPVVGLRVKKLAVHLAKGEYPSAQIRAPLEFITALNKAATKREVSRTDIMRELASKVK